MIRRTCKLNEDINVKDIIDFDELNDNLGNALAKLRSIKAYCRGMENNSIFSGPYEFRKNLDNIYGYLFDLDSYIDEIHDILNEAYDKYSI